MAKYEKTINDPKFICYSSGTLTVTLLSFKGILKDVGITKKSKVIEVQRPDLVGRYLGETALQTKASIEKAKDGVLFVDEAYRLKVDSEKDYGKEALDTLMEAMLGGNPVMIFAGYPAQMEDFMKLNPGFKRRIRSIFHFHDYSCAELAEVFMLKVESRGFETEVSVADLTDILENKTTEDFRKEWNAGLCDRLFELAKENLDERLLSDSLSLKSDGPELSKICMEDIVNAMDSI